MPKIKISRNFIKSVPRMPKDYFTWRADSFSRATGFVFRGVVFGNFLLKSSM